MSPNPAPLLPRQRPRVGPWPSRERRGNGSSPHWNVQAGPALSGPFALGEKLGGTDLGRPDFEILGGLVIILRQQSPPTVRLPRHGLRDLGRFIGERDPLPRVGRRVRIRLPPAKSLRTIGSAVSESTRSARTRGSRLLPILENLARADRRSDA